MQQAQDFLKESKLLYDLLKKEMKLIYELITQFKKLEYKRCYWSFYLFNVAAIRTVDGPKSFDDFFMPFYSKCKKAKLWWKHKFHG